MAKARTLEDTLTALHQLRGDPSSAASLATLRQVLTGKASHAIAKAAQIAGEFEISALTPDLVNAFDRLMNNAVKSDPGCRGKAEIADALYRIGADETAVFLRGIRHQQMEPVWGGRVDTATALRGACALGLVRMNYRDVLSELADLLADPEVQARVAAARALAYSENEQALPLLRLKVLVGDDEPEVLSECLTALLKIAPGPSLAFVAKQLDAPRAPTREAAALALGGSRLRDAFSVLRDWWNRLADPDPRRVALLAIAMLKHDEPIEFLLSLIATADGPTARQAITALALYRHDEVLTARVEQTVAQRKDAKLRPAFTESFGAPAER
ncbi:MAG: HEAT repeat domain-containing protein [Deltaproteobacteria bacterium]|nr:HEAT repeat domain-containing protein [Deltaproteobacteria bacterium]MBI3388980.1 HEAT repeat domain-containing protein [Deltaproteobacteria bacterium]